MDLRYFRVSSEWMQTFGFEETYGQSKVFEVVRIKTTPVPTDNIIVLKCEHIPNGEWMVFESRGHYVAPFTLLLSDGLFVPAPADIEERGTDLKTHSEFDTFDLAQLAAIRLNEAIRLVYTSSIPTALIEEVAVGEFIRRIASNGMPMAKTYKRGEFDSERQRFTIINPLDSDKRLYLPVGTLVATESYD